jgi:hypothetical protein
MVFKLLKLLIGIGCLGIFAWWAATVPLGERTLFEHLRAIGKTKESQELVRGTKEKASEMKKRLAGRGNEVAHTRQNAVMGTLEGFPNPPATGSGGQSLPAPTR